MKFSEIVSLAPAEVPAASVQLRGHSVDVFRLTSGDVFAVLAKAPGIVEAWNSDGNDRVKNIMSAIAAAGPDVVAALLASGLRADVEAVKAFKLSLEEELSIGWEIVSQSIPGELLEKIAVELEIRASGLGLTQSAN